MAFIVDKEELKSGLIIFRRADVAHQNWYCRIKLTYNFILIMCNTGMRPSEAKNLRRRDITPANDREGREIVVLFVQGKGKSRKLVAPKSVGDYLDRVRAIAKATEPDARVFTTIDGEPTQSLYNALVGDLLDTADLREGTQAVPRSTYCFRHTYSTMRLPLGPWNLRQSSDAGSSPNRDNDSLTAKLLPEQVPAKSLPWRNPT